MRCLHAALTPSGPFHEKFGFLCIVAGKSPLMDSIFFLSLMNGAAWGGSEELWYRTALQAAAKGLKVGCAFYAWKEKEQKIETLRKAGCQVYLLPNKGRDKANLGERLRYKISRWQVNQIAGNLPFHDYSLVVVNLGGFEIYTSTWKNLYRKLPAYALLFHNYDEGANFKPAKAKRLRRWIGGAAANLFAARRIGETLEEKLHISIPHSGVFINPITFIPPSAPAPYPALEQTVSLVMLAELDVSRKAQDNLLKALASPKWKIRDWHLSLYGKGNDKSLLQGLIGQLGLSEKVALMGHSSNVKDVLQQAHLVLQITHRDAMPLAVMEAMAMARPVVVSKVGDMPSWVEEDRNGWMAANASVGQIDAVLEKAWQHKNQWPVAGRQSFARFAEKFPASPEERFLRQLQPAAR
ncbi:glycosyltransferase [Flavisolibacter nicotianae]|uniref:glycosyltransferase n=1 Tax=Flavisolibacter nicotianae TaxID=2364882 RepID=UPI000EAB78B0|nr:glycosyltransferase [Flavisolibacter nicotianae]